MNEKAFGKNSAQSIAGKEVNSLSHRNLVHKFIPMPQTMMIPDAKAAVDKRIGKAQKIASIANDQSQEQKREAIKEAQKEERTVRSGTLMDICHLKNSELGPQISKR